MAQGDYDAAQKMEEESLLLLRESNQASTIAYVIHNLGDLAYLRRQAADARAHYEEACALFEEQGDQWGICVSLLRLGSVALLEGNLQEAWSECQKALAAADELDEKRLQAESLEMLAAILHARHADDNAARLWGMAEQRRDSLHSEREPFDLAAYTALHTELREVLGEERFAVLCVEGRNWTPHDVAILPFP
jgi:tetratricopeptide (TPR) repeat protein